jgi:hypothetical protein
MILKKDFSSDDESSISNKQSKTNEKSSDASSSTICKLETFRFFFDIVKNRNMI